jgi:hypothetical protein
VARRGGRLDAAGSVLLRPIVEAVVPDGILHHYMATDLGDTCRIEGEGGCELGVSIELPEGAAVTVAATAEALTYGDTSFFFPEDRDFPVDAVVEVGFE